MRFARKMNTDDTDPTDFTDWIRVNLSHPPHPWSHLESIVLPIIRSIGQSASPVSSQLSARRCSMVSVNLNSARILFRFKRPKFGAAYYRCRNILADFVVSNIDYADSRESRNAMRKIALKPVRAVLRGPPEMEDFEMRPRAVTE